MARHAAVLGVSAGAGSAPDDSLDVEAPAKINPFLRILGRRPDGYHELETLILPISLADRLRIHAAADPNARTLALQLEVSGPPDVVEAVPLDESNLVMRAAGALAEAASVRGFADFLLEKRIRPAAGLGGGSADAAAALRGLNQLWECGLDPRALSEVAASVGSDVPALLAGTSAVARGRGERVDPVPAAGMRWCLVTFPFAVRTADAFQWWDEDGGPSGPDPTSLLEAIAAGDAEAAGGLLFNDLEGPVSRRHPEVAQAKRRLEESGAWGAVMCGSGPSVAGLLGTDGALPESTMEVWSGRSGLG